MRKMKELDASVIEMNPAEFRNVETASTTALVPQQHDAHEKWRKGAWEKCRARKLRLEALTHASYYLKVSLWWNLLHHELWREGGFKSQAQFIRESGWPKKSVMRYRTKGDEIMTKLYPAIEPDSRVEFTEEMAREYCLLERKDLAITPTMSQLMIADGATDQDVQEELAQTDSPLLLGDGQSIIRYKQKREAEQHEKSAQKPDPKLRAEENVRYRLAEFDNSAVQAILLWTENRRLRPKRLKKGEVYRALHTHERKRAVYSLWFALYLVETDVRYNDESKNTVDFLSYDDALLRVEDLEELKLECPPAYFAMQRVLGLKEEE